MNCTTSLPKFSAPCDLVRH